MSDTSTKIDLLVNLVEHPRTGEGERAAAARMLERLRRKAAEQGDDVSETSATWGRYYRLPERRYGAKYDGWLSSAELAKRIREDIKVARKVGKTAAKPGDVKFADPIGDAPPSVRFSVRKEDFAGGRAIDVTIRGVPQDWWVDRKTVPSYTGYPNYTYRAPGPQLEALADALREILWAHNYDGSDAMVDYFDKNFYSHVSADGHGEHDYPRNI